MTDYSKIPTDLLEAAVFRDTYRELPPEVFDSIAAETGVSSDLERLAQWEKEQA